MVRAGNKRGVYHRGETRLLTGAGCSPATVPHGLARLRGGIDTHGQGDADPWLLNNQLLFSPDQQSQDFAQHATPKMRLRIG